ncbi:EAL domain-containing protein [Marinobacter daepoensis]|uniref:EAL domain-containing protein n=1 Tax=Marinobacter daepoensis TaxID=262077 RepID=UPI000409CAE3|nr:EAL domain-containing protein [Marinobacter daepoensis]
MSEDTGFEFFPVCDVATGTLHWVDVVDSGLSGLAVAEDALVHDLGWLEQMAADSTLSFALRGLTKPGNTADRLLELLRSHRLDPGRIQLELSSSELQGDPAACASVSELYSRGFRLSVGAFLTDDAGFWTLSNPHIHAIKCDWNHLMRLESSELRQRFLKGLIGLCEALRKQLVVAGVDCDTVLQQLVALGVKLVQGRAVAGPYKDAGFLTDLPSLA